MTYWIIAPLNLNWNFIFFPFMIWKLWHTANKLNCDHFADFLKITCTLYAKWVLFIHSWYYSFIFISFYLLSIFISSSNNTFWISFYFHFWWNWKFPHISFSKTNIIEFFWIVSFISSNYFCKNKSNFIFHFLSQI